jgi:hypothetical protein
MEIDIIMKSKVVGIRKVIIICNKKGHGEFYKHIHNHIMERCPKCEVKR